MLDLERFIADCRDALTQDHTQLRVRELVARTVADRGAAEAAGDFFDTPRSEWTPDTLVERPFDMERARRAYAEANERWERKAP